MKHFVDIQVLRENDEEILDGIIKKANCSAFSKGDLISITEKVDGSNASICLEDGVIKSFSRKDELNFKNTLDGFWNFANSLDKKIFEGNENKVIFGEWLRKNKIKYDAENMHKWYVYSIYDKENEKWLDRDFVKDFCERNGLIYVHELYYGPFISWEHCKTFMNSPIYGDTQEGIVVRNVSKINDETIRDPFILKIVNASFKEKMKVRIREIDPEKEKAKEEARVLMESIVTRARVEKGLFKLRDEGKLPESLTPNDMGIVARYLPKYIFEDCLKEEPETVMAAGEYGGKAANSICMNIAREIIIGR